MSPPTAEKSPGSPFASLVIRLGIVAVIVGGLAAAFAYAGGWLSPHKVTPKAIVDALEQSVGGPHEGFRRNHAKGVCFTGYFDANGQGVALSKAVVFADGRTPVVGRFALAGSQPNVGDDVHTVRSLAVEFDLTDGQQWRMAINAVPVFAVKSPEGFYDLVVAGTPDRKTGKPNPANMAAFQTKHPESIPALKQIGGRSIATGFDNETYNSLDAFEFVAADGTVTPVRWSMVPVQPFVAIPTTAPAMVGKEDKNALFDALIAAAHAHPLQWHLVITMGQPGDDTADATVAWPSDRKQIDVGTLTVEQIDAEESSRVRDINFDPLVLPDGIRGSDDPLLSARSAAYAVSHRRREGETKQPSPVSPAEVHP